MLLVVSGIKTECENEGGELVEILFSYRPGCLGFSSFINTTKVVANKDQLFSTGHGTA